MSDSDSLTKRICTDDGKRAFIPQSSQESATAPADLTNQLRNIGSRIRKNVTEGYTTPPSSRVFAKAQSTTTIFATAKDINREIFGHKSESQTPLIPTGSTRKRSRSVSDQTNQATTKQQDSGDFYMEVEEGTTDITNITTDTGSGLQDKDKREIKPLRKTRGLMGTLSLPVGVARFPNHSLDSNHPVSSTMESDDEWSIQYSTNNNQPTFQPIVL